MAIDTTTGITTFVTFSDPTASRKFQINDVVQIDSEQFLIINFDDVNNKHGLRRKHNSTSAATHASGTLIKKLQLKPFRIFKYFWLCYLRIAYKEGTIVFPAG